MTRERAGFDLDIPDFQPRAKPLAPDAGDVKAAAERAGFVTRHAPAATPQPTTPASFDARSLRRSNRTAKLNIATTEEARQRFWMLAQKLGTSSGEDTLIAMMDALEREM